MNVKVDVSKNLLYVQHTLLYNNSSNDSIKQIVLNDWNNAFSSKNSALARRFSDEFVRSFHLAKNDDRGYTEIKSVFDADYQTINWERTENTVDLVYLNLNNPIAPCSQQTITLQYIVKIPNEKFTKYGFDTNGNLVLKNWYLNPARFENKRFVEQSNENLDDIPNAFGDFEIEVEIDNSYFVSSNLNEVIVTSENSKKQYFLEGKSKTDVVLYLQQKNTFTTYKNDIIEVSSDINAAKLDEFQKARIIDKIAKFTSLKLGDPLINKVLVSQQDYQREPYYGLNQLPSFLSPFPDEFMFELKFLKTYLNNYLKENLQLNARKDYWIYDGFQVFLMMQYVEENYPDLKMTGSLANFKILKSYYFINLPFNQQYNYLYMLMARKNLDQPLSEPKNKLIKFNEKIANKYKAGLSLNYLDNYLENNIVLSSMKQFIQENKAFETNSLQFATLLKKNAPKNIDWFFDTVIEKKDLIDYTFGQVKKTNDSIAIKVINKTNTNTPVTLYQLKNDEVISKVWLNNITTDSTLIFKNSGADKLVLNYYNEMPEYNLRNNWKSLKGFFSNNRPIKFNFMKDLEEPYYNQIFYVPEVEFNAYDGIAIGMKLNNKSILNKSFSFSTTPMYSTNTGKLTGKAAIALDDFIRAEGKLYNIRYILSGSQFHYAPDAMYTNLVPTVRFSFRDQNRRTNKNEFVQLRQVYVNREASPFITNTTANYNIFNAKYGNYQSEVTKYFSLLNDFQISSSFGKISTEIHYRKLFENNRQISLRLFAGAFMYRSTNSEFFSFGLDRPNDYMFDYNLLGRSETTGIYSQQYIYAEGGFKSKLDTRFANQWITTINGSFNIWNWIQIYGDVGLLKNKYTSTKFVYDSGFHLNLVPDYFELFLPVYSSNGFELNTNRYGEKIRFVVTLSPKTLVSLFTRKWF